GATGDGAVDELDVGVLLVEHADQRVETRLLGARGPPREDLDLAAGAVTAVIAARAAVAARSQRETDHGSRRHRRGHPPVHSHLGSLNLPRSLEHRLGTSVPSGTTSCPGPAGRACTPVNPRPIE